MRVENSPVSFKSKVEFATKEARAKAPLLKKLINHIKHHTESNKYTYLINANDQFLMVDSFLYAERKADGIVNHRVGVGQVGGTLEKQIDYVLKHLNYIKSKRTDFNLSNKVSQTNADNPISIPKKRTHNFIKRIKSFFNK